MYTQLTIIEASKDLTCEPTLPRYTKRPRRVDDGEPGHRYETPKAYFRQQYFELLDLVHDELNRRFQQKNGIPVAASIEKLLLEAANGTLSDSCDISEQLKLYAKNVDIPHLKTEFQMLPDLVKTYNENNRVICRVTNVRTLGELMNNVSDSKLLFREVFKLTKIFFTIPVTTATAERTFSTLRHLKTFLRSALSQPNLNHYMLLHTHKERTDCIDLVHIAKDFVSVNERRRNVFGSFQV